MTKLGSLIVLLWIMVSCSKDTEGPSHFFRPTIAVYGGSVSNLSEADSSKLYWQQKLGIPVYTYSRNGCGFSNETPVPVSQQVEGSSLHRIVIFWCSTNDFQRTIENPDNPYDPSTQNGGIRRAYKLVKMRIPNAKVMLFTSLPCFDGRDGTEAVAGQIKVCKELEIPYLDQFRLFDESDYQSYYKEDKTHLKVEGYLKIRDIQLDFIKYNLPAWL